MITPSPLRAQHQTESTAQLRQLQEERAKQIVLHEVTWIVTYQCHLNCAYCYVPTTRAKCADDSVLSVSQVADILAQARSFGATRFMLRGGEPFLRLDIADILYAADLLGFQTDLLTKVAPSPRQIGVLARLRGLSLGISLDTTNVEVGDQLLGRAGQTAALMRAVKRLADAGLPPIVAATVTQPTFAGLDSLIAFCVIANVRHLHLREIAPHHTRPVSDLLLTPEMSSSLAKRAGTVNGLEVSVTPAFAPSPSCGEGIDALTFLPDGSVTKCTASLSKHSVMHYGNLAKQSVADVMTGPALSRLLDQVVRSGNSLRLSDLPSRGRLPCSQLVALRSGDPFPK